MIDAPERPRLSRGRRRIRGHPAGCRHRHRPDGGPTDPCRSAQRRRPDPPDRAVLVVDRRLGVPVAEHEGRAAVPPRGCRPVLVQAPRPDERGRLRPGSPWRHPRRALDGGHLRGDRDDRRQAAADAGLSADLLAQDRQARRLRGSDPADRGLAARRCQQPVRGGRARRSDRRDRLCLPGCRGGGRRRARRGRLSERQPVTPDPRVRAVPSERR